MDLRRCCHTPVDIKWHIKLVVVRALADYGDVPRPGLLAAGYAVLKVQLKVMLKVLLKVMLKVLLKVLW